MPGPDTTTAELVAGFFLVLAALTALVLLTRPIYMPLWHLFRRTQQFLEDWFGEPARAGQPARPGAMQRLQSVEAIALRSEKELHPNGGSSLRDDVLAVGAKVEESRDLSSRAAQRAEDTARQVENAAESARAERASIQDALREGLSDLEERMAVSAAEKTADWLALLAEEGGPDLRRHAPPVAPHAHQLPARNVPTVTSGPVAANDEAGR